jgi:hypothetical protein
MIITCVRWYLGFRLVHLFGALRDVMCYMDYSLWQFIAFLAAAYPT